jgi:small subunit ribosomal protein S17
MSDETKDTAQVEQAEQQVEKPTTGFKRKLAGRVKSNKMTKTVVVQVIRYFRHPVYKKYVRSRTSYKAHDEENTCRVGDRVEIIESRPMSREKRWKVVRVLERAVID